MAEHLKEQIKPLKGIDPWFAGTRQIARSLQENGFHIKTASQNHLFPAHFQIDTAAYKDKKLGHFDYVITSPPFAFIDIIAPLFAKRYEATFLHVPSWYLFQGSTARRRWIERLIKTERMIVLHINPERNQDSQRFAVWVCIFRTKSMANKYLKNTTKLRNKALQVYFTSWTKSQGAQQLQGREIRMLNM